MIVQNEPVTGSPFGNAFSDFVADWRQLVTTDNPNGVVFEFTIPISSTPDRELSISRLEVISSGDRDIVMQALHSSDNVNFTKFPGAAESMTVSPGRTVALDFESTRVQFLRFRFTVSEASVVEGNSYGYVLSLRAIRPYLLGRQDLCEFISKPLTPTGLETIDKVSVNVIEVLSPGTAIDYFVAADDGEGAPRDGAWRPITPIGRAVVEGVPQVVRFGQTADVTQRLPAPSPALPYDTVRGVDYFRLTEDVLEHTPMFRTARLFRGRNAWSRNAQRNPIIKEVRDAFIDFGTGDIQYLYAVATERPDISRGTRTTTTTPQTVLTVSHDVRYDPATMLLKPPKNTNPESDQRPNYAVYRVERFRDTMVIENEEVVLPSGDDSWAQLAETGVQAVGVGRPVVRNTSESVTYIEGRDYVLEYVQQNDNDAPPVLTGRLKRRADQSGLPNSNISQGQSLKVSYSLQSDITYMADAARGKDIFLDRDLGEVPDQYFQVTYRFIPKLPDNPVKKSSLEVRSNYGTLAGGKLYAEGPDYIVDTSQGTITRIPTGQITPQGNAYVDFQYEEQPEELDTFTLWVRVDKRDPIRVEFNPIGADVDAGERVLVNGSDVTRELSFPELAFGWHQIVVKSKRPEEEGTAAVNLLAELVDRENDSILIASGKYFAEIVATREPMLQRTYVQLTKNTAKGDHTWFAVTTDGHVVINFEPNSTEETYTYATKRDEDQQLVTQIWPEEFALEYTYALETAEPVTAVLFRALLRRIPGADGGVTPKLFEYHLRLA